MQDVATDLRASGVSLDPQHPSRRASPWISGVLAIAIAGSIAVWQIRPRQRPAAAPVRTAAKTIVILPFENLGGSEGEMFAAGMTDEITTRLASMSALAVISRTTAMRYRDRRVGARQIGRELGVEYVLDGTVRWDASGRAPRVRVSPQLIRVSDDMNVWVSRFDAPLEDVFEVQSHIAAEIAGALNVRLLEREKQSLREVPTTSLAAYRLYREALDGLHHQAFSPDAHRRQIDMFAQAVKLDPSFAAAWAWLSVAKSYAYYAGLDRTPENLAAARKAGEEALRLAPELSSSHFALGMHYWWDLTNAETATRYLHKAAELAPSDADVWQALGQIARYEDEYEEAQAYFSRAAKLDPLNTNVVAENAQLATIVRQYDRADRWCDRLVTLTSGAPDAYGLKLNVLLLRDGPSDETRALVRTHLSGSDSVSRTARLTALVVDRRYDEALTTLHGLNEDVVRYWWIDGAPRSLVEADIQRLAGRSADARRLFEQARRELIEQERQHPGDERNGALLRIADAGLGRRTPGPTKNIFELILTGDHDRAIALIDANLKTPSWLSKPFVRADPHYDPLRAHPRFRALVQ
jgi:TolB-like protein